MTAVDAIAYGMSEMDRETVCQCLSVALSLCFSCRDTLFCRLIHFKIIGYSCNLIGSQHSTAVIPKLPVH